MSLVRMQRLQASTRMRLLGRGAALALPWLLAANAVALRIGAAAWALPVVVLVLALALAAWRWRALDLKAVARALDARHPALEDSAALLLQPPASLGALAQLQRERVSQRLAALSPAPVLLPPFARRRAALNAIAAFAVAALATWLQWPAAPVASAPTPVVAARAPLPPGLVAARLQVQPPAYTGLPASRVDGLTARVPEGSTVHWRLRTQGRPASVSLRFHDGSTLALRREGDAWTAARPIERTHLYRVRVDGRDTPWQRLAVIADRAPRLRVLAPERSLSLVEPGQARWSLDVEAQDDYGLGPAQLRITLAQGSGENIQVSARELAIAGQGSARARRYRHTLDLAGLGFAAGDDLVVRLTVADNRRPAPQRTHSPSFILRWPPEASAQAGGLEGMVQRQLPAYFRSQRQIIIDTEALLAMKPRPVGDDWATRSDTIGEDQRLLRLRYGQFLGEESENEGEDAEHAGPEPARGDAAAVMAQFGHTHDIPEAATLLDPQTRKLLKAALDAMWAAERELRVGKPREALPHEYSALRLVKQVQQASRIYLARVGLEQAPVDMARRLNGKREGIAPVVARGTPQERAEPAPARALWDALEGGDRDAAARAATRLERAIADEPGAADSLGLLGALDAWRADPACAPCVARLRARLWPRLPPAAAALPPREAADARGRVYLDALSPEALP